MAMEEGTSNGEGHSPVQRERKRSWGQSEEGEWGRAARDGSEDS